MPGASGEVASVPSPTRCSSAARSGSTVLAPYDDRDPTSADVLQHIGPQRVRHQPRTIPARLGVVRAGRPTGEQPLRLVVELHGVGNQHG